MKYRYAKLTKEQGEILIKAWKEYTGPIGPDYLAYTPEFGEIAEKANKRARMTYTTHTLWCNFINIRKGGGKIKMRRGVR